MVKKQKVCFQPPKADADMLASSTSANDAAKSCVNANMTSQRSGQVSPRPSPIGSNFPCCFSTFLGGRSWAKRLCCQTSS